MSEETQAVETASTTTEAPAERPDYIPEKFWDADENTTNVEALARSYVELERFTGKKRDEIREEVINQYTAELNQYRPEAADKYIVEFAEDHPFHAIQDSIDPSDPLITMWRETAYKAGLSNEEFTKGIETWVHASMGNRADREDVAADLGENGNARIEAVEMWAARNLEQAEYEALAATVTSAESFRALEKLMNSSRSTSRTAYTEDSVIAKPSREELNSAMNDPRYWDPARRDPAYVRQIENMTRRMSSR